MDMQLCIRCRLRSLVQGVTSATLIAVTAQAQDRVRVASPDGRNVVTVQIQEGRLSYSLERDGRAILLPSRLGFEFRDARPLGDGLGLVDTARSTVDETWTQPWGEVARVRDHHNELKVSVAQTTSNPGSASSPSPRS